MPFGVVEGIITVTIAVAIVGGTAYTVYATQRSTKEFEQQRKLSEKWRKEDVNYMTEQANTNMILAVVGIIISLISMYMMYRRR